MKVHKGYKFKLEPTEEQKIKINKTLGCCRFVYNSMLDRRIKAYTRRGESMSYIDTQNLLPKMKQYLPWLAEVDSQALKDSGTANVYIPITFDVDSAFGLDVCDTTKSRKPDYINLYINYSKNGDMELFIDYCNNSTSDGDIDVAVELTPEQYKAVKKRFETQFKNAYGISIADAIKQECKLEG